MHRMVCSMILITGLLQAASAQYQGWQHSGSIYLLTTPEGANLPSAASEDGFPLLVRLHKDSFDFSQAKAGGEDIRFSTSAGTPLPYQVEEWDAANGSACLWVRIPTIKGNERQEIKMYWGKGNAAGESSGPAVFNESNGSLSVWHMTEPVKAEAGTLDSKDTGPTSASGIIGKCRRFDAGKGINCGEKITNYPSGSSPHSSEVWFRPEQPNTTILAWGNEQAQGKVVMQFSSPPHINMDCYFSGGNVASSNAFPMSQWTHVAHTYTNGDSRIYVNGILAGVNTSRGGPLAIKNPVRMYLGGWYNHYTFVGDLDEVRISKVTRSADWVRLAYENQNPLQTLAGSLVQAGSDFSVSEKQLTLLEGRSATVSARAGGAQKVYWMIKQGGTETVAAVDRFHFTINAGRVAGDESLTLQFKAVYADAVKTLEIPVTIREDIPEPVFTLKAPAKWDGRATIEVAAQISNLEAMRTKGAGELKYDWAVSGLAVIKEIAPGKLILKRAQNSGKMTVTATVSNGGKPATQVVQITVNEPRKDAWVQRASGKDEKPLDNQFYARDDKNEGTLYYHGALSNATDSVFLRVYADDKVFKTESQQLKADKTYAFAIKLKPGLIKYKVEFGTRSGNRETVLHTVTNLVCGDAYLIDGQSNALAVDWGAGEHPDTSEWVCSFAAMSGEVSQGWGTAVRRHGPWEIGCWGMDLATNLVAAYHVPICIINGAVGGTLIEMHQRNPTNHTDLGTIYGRLLKRIELAHLTHGIRGAFWHQGENNQGTQGATGRYGWETYEDFFVEMTAAWKQDYTNLQHYYIFQIWPNSCSMGGNRASDKLRDVQRLLPRLYSRMSSMSTLGIKPVGPCHFPPAGYAELARAISPLVERDNYGKVFDKPITPPDVNQAYYTGEKRDEIALEFDQPMAWSDALTSQFYLDGKEGQIASGSVSGNVVKLKLASATAATTITYLADKKWDPNNLLYGQNGLAALTFCEVPVLAGKPTTTNDGNRPAAGWRLPPTGKVTHRGPPLVNYHHMNLPDGRVDRREERLAQWDVVILNHDLVLSAQLSLAKMRQTNPRLKILAWVPLQGPNKGLSPGVPPAGPDDWFLRKTDGGYVVPHWGGRLLNPYVG